MFKRGDSLTNKEKTIFIYVLGAGENLYLVRTTNVATGEWIEQAVDKPILEKSFFFREEEMGKLLHLPIQTIQ